MQDPHASIRPLDPAVAARFAEAPWTAPLRKGVELAAIPEHATISGMFLQGVVDGVRHTGRALPSARRRYTAFSFYPLNEHVQLMFEAAEVVYPERPLRLALRSMGRGAPQALLQSTLGKVVLSSAFGVQPTIASLAKAYELNLRPGAALVVEEGRNYMVIALQEVHYLVDSHHVGVFEGGLSFAQAPNRKVRICTQSRSRAELLLTWDA